MKIKRIMTIILGMIILMEYTYSQTVGNPNYDYSPFDVFIFPVPTPKNGSTKDIISQSPKVASLGIFGQIPVGNFTGTATISIPIFTVSYKDLSLPISISYNTLGNKPDILPGPVGMGWALQAGGMISRKTNGNPDRGGEVIDDYNYYFNFDSRNRDDWYDVNKYYSDIWTSLSNFEGHIDPDEFSFNINGQTGSFFINTYNENYENSTTVVRSDQGEFFHVIWHKRVDLNYTLFPEGKPIQFNSPSVLQELFPLHAYYNSNYPYNNTISICNWINGFTMIDSQGIKYNFGNPNSLKEFDDAIEFSRLGHADRSFRTDTWFGVYQYEEYFRKFVQANTWYLTSIESPSGYTIKLNYKREYYVTKFRFTDFAFIKKPAGFSVAQNAVWRDALRSVFINGSYLSEIEFPEGKVEFTNSEAIAQLKYPSNGSYDTNELKAYSYDEPFKHLNQFFYYPDISFANPDKIGEYGTVESFMPNKIDNIIVKDKSGATIRSINFNYTISNDTRLKLLSLAITGTNINTTGLKYKFEYNMQKTLPEYFSNMTDYYGFYNGKKIFEGMDFNNSHTYTISEDPDYYNNIKSPDFNFAKAEILTKIVYPTGGYSILEYEPHNYSKVFKSHPYFDVRDASEELDLTKTDAGGLRIKKVENFDVNNNLLNSKNYVYKTLSGNLSGVLAYGSPTYVETDHPSRNFTRISSNPAHPMSFSRGNHVTYSEVKVIEGANEGINGYTVYKYKNYDNNYGDQSLKGYIAKNTVAMEDEEGINMKHERGQPLSEEVYNKGDTIIRKTKYFYNENPDRFNENIKYIRKIDGYYKLDGKDEYTIVTAGVNYTYHPYLKEKKETLYLNSGDSIISTSKFEYNENYRLLKSTEFTDSRGDKLRNEIYYPFDDNTGIYKTMTDNYFLSYPTATVSTKNNEIILKTKTEYSSGLAQNNEDLILPHKESVQRGTSSMQLESTYNSYDKIGNPLLITDEKTGYKVCYLWSYNGSYPISKIVGLDYEQVNTVLTGNSISIKNLWEETNPEQIQNCVKTVHTALSNAGALVTTYTYQPFFGMMTETDFRGITAYYEYDGLGRLTEVKAGKKDAPTDEENKINIESYDYHYNTSPATIVSHEITGNNIKINYMGCINSGQNVKITLKQNDLIQTFTQPCTGTAVVTTHGLTPNRVTITVKIEIDEKVFEDSINIFFPGYD